MGRIYEFHCNACGKTFTPERKNARTCSDICRLAIANAHETVKSKDPILTEDEHKQSDEIKIKIESGSGIIRQVTGKNKGGNFIIKEEDVKKIFKKKSKVPKNDKNLIPGETGKEQEKLQKKERKSKKKGAKE